MGSAAACRRAGAAKQGGGLLGVTLTITLIAAEVLAVGALVVTVLLRRNLDPATRLAWLTVLVLLPVVGIIAYLLVGEARLGGRRIRRHREVVLTRRETANTPPAPGHAPVIAEPLRQIALLAESVGGDLPAEGNVLTLLGDSEESMRSLIRDIDQARDHCHIVTYIYLTDATGRAVADAVIRAERRGVQCRVLVDSVGSAAFLDSDLCDAMRMEGVQVVGALPVNPLRSKFARFDLRNHRKIAVIDGRIGHTGSQNIADAAFAPKRRYAPWVDASVRIEGPLVHDLARLFAEDWYLDTDEWLGETLHTPPSPIPGGVIAQFIGTGPNAYNQAMRQVYLAACQLAREELILTTPYFVPDEATVVSLATAARRGVTTELVVPKRNDSRLVAAASRAYYEPLLEAGVHIHEYAAGLLHAKTLTMDRELAIMSSANLDRRSLFLNFESSVIVYDDDFTGHLRLLQRTYMSRSRRIDPLRWAKRPWPRRLAQNVAGLFSPLL